MLSSSSNSLSLVIVIVWLLATAIEQNTLNQNTTSPSHKNAHSTLCMERLYYNVKAYLSESYVTLNYEPRDKCDTIHHILQGTWLTSRQYGQLAMNLFMQMCIWLFMVPVNMLYGYAIKLEVISYKVQFISLSPWIQDTVKAYPNNGLKSSDVSSLCSLRVSQSVRESVSHSLKVWRLLVLLS